jgi:hypothetical protein
MKNLKYLAIVTVLSIVFFSCEDRSKATLGGTKDTVAKAGTGDPNNTHALDSAKNDSTNVNKGNVDPSGRIK